MSSRVETAGRDVLAPSAPDAVECGPVWLSPHAMCELRVRGQRVPMSETQLRMLASLIRAQGQIISREELLGADTSGDYATPSRSVDIHVHRIRLALGPLGRHIIAVRGRGYRIDTRGLARAR